MKSHKTIIDGIEIEIIKFNPFKGGTLLGTTMKMFAPALKDIIKAAEGKLSDAEQIDVIIGAIQDLFTTNSPDEVMVYIKSVLTEGHVIVGKKKLMDLDDLESMAGEEDSMYLMLMLTAESIKYNFSGLMGKLMQGQAS